MSYLENKIFCSAEEYERGLPSRVHEANVREGDIYTLTLRLDSERRQAAKFAVKALCIARQAGVMVVMFDYLDDDLNPTKETQATMADGLVSELTTPAIRDNHTRETFPILHGYLRDYFDDQFEGLLVESDILAFSR